MPEKIKCECGHYEYEPAIKEIDNETYCKECWKRLMEIRGKVEKGCIMPGAAVCPDRDPSIINISINPEENKGTFQNARCYRGHKECIREMKESEKNFDILGQVLDGEATQCPREGCSHELSTVKTERAVTCICPVHGCIFRAILRPKES